MRFHYTYISCIIQHLHVATHACTPSHTQYTVAPLTVLSARGPWTMRTEHLPVGQDPLQGAQWQGTQISTRAAQGNTHHTSTQ